MKIKIQKYNNKVYYLYGDILELRKYAESNFKQLDKNVYEVTNNLIITFAENMFGEKRGILWRPIGYLTEDYVKKFIKEIEQKQVSAPY